MSHNALNESVRGREPISRMERRVLVTRLLVGTVLLLTACEDAGGPVEPSLASLYVHAAVNAVQVSTVVVEVTAADITTPLIFNLTVTDGAASATIVE